MLIGVHLIKNEWGGWVNVLCELESALQSAWGMGLAGASLQFGFVLTPSGGCYVEDESLNCIISRNTFITIKHTYDNCVWFALVSSYSIGNRKTRFNEYDKPHGIATAKELCVQMLS